MIDDNGTRRDDVDCGGDDADGGGLGYEDADDDCDGYVDDGGDDPDDGAWEIETGSEIHCDDSVNDNDDVMENHLKQTEVAK